ncbi:hypothetical protein [Cognaticolwellia mytili]|uniref:hypothetical protein n=1 Tax=Cognaticolwellia mytili TaxID=1888913 RepID=UPI000A17193E|nr:hypothetical protein [Cognaticolwellia mytili]
MAKAKFTIGMSGTEHVEQLQVLSDAVGDIDQAKLDAQQALDDAIEQVALAAQQVALAAVHQENAEAIAVSGLPSQATHIGKALVTNGISISWESVVTPVQLTTVLQQANIAIQSSNTAISIADKAKLTARIGLVL